MRRATARSTGGGSRRCASAYPRARYIAARRSHHRARAACGSRGHRFPYCPPVTGSTHPHRRNTDPSSVMAALPHRARDHEDASSMRPGERDDPGQGDDNKCATDRAIPRESPGQATIPRMRKANGVVAAGVPHGYGYQGLLGVMPRAVWDKSCQVPANLQKR